jgi:hypothetical protein
MAQTRGSLSQLHDNTDRKVFVMLNQQLKKLPPGWRKRIKVETSSRQTEIAMNIVGFGDTPEKPEGQPYVTDLLRPGHEKRVSHTEFGLGFEVTQTALEDDRHDQLTKYGMWLTFSANYVLGKRAANLYNNGFTTELTADGLSIFNTAHVMAGASGGTFRNRPTSDVALSWNAVRDAIIDLETETKHDSGQLASSVESLRLVIPPHLEMLADRILNSTNLPGVADNDRNSIKTRRNIEIDVDKLLTDTNAWFLQAADNDMHGLRAYERVGLSQDEPMTDARTKNRLYTIRGRYSWYGLFPQNSWGTAGA